MKDSDKPDGMRVGNHLESALCIGCDKPERECVILETEAFTGPHCAKCLFREAKKRTKKDEAKPNLFGAQAG